jgi:hypothetical protein
MSQNNPYDDFLQNISSMVEDIIRNIPEKGGTHFIGFTIIAGKPGGPPQIIPMDNNPGEEIEYEVIEDEHSLFVTGKLPPHSRSAAYADISADGVTIVVGERKASIPLDVRIDVIHSYYRIRHGVIDIVLKKKKS